MAKRLPTEERGGTPRGRGQARMGAELLRAFSGTSDALARHASARAAGAGREVPAGGPGYRAGFHGGGDRALVDQHERHLPLAHHEPPFEAATRAPLVMRALALSSPADLDQAA